MNKVSAILGNCGSVFGETCWNRGFSGRTCDRLELIERKNRRSFCFILLLVTFGGPRLPMSGRTIPKEVEVKLELLPASLRVLKKVPLFKTPPRHTREVSVYFDTNKHKLRKNGLMLRVRRTRNRYVQTIKATNNSWTVRA